MASTQKLAERPGWAKLRRATADLHAAEVLLADPIAPHDTAVPHLRDFWRGMAAAGRAAEIGDFATADDPAAWLESDLVGVDARARARLLQLYRSLDAESPPTDAQLRAHARAARELVVTLEPHIGGQPLRMRKRRLLWGSVGLVILFGPLLGYVALHREVDGEGPWRAAYYTDRKLESRPIVVREPEIVHDWGKDAPLEAVPPDKFSVRWDTCLKIDEAGPVVFQVNANDGARLSIDGEQIVDAWDRDEKTRRRGFGTGEVQLESGVHHLRVEYFESLGSASIKLAASLDGELPVPLERDRLLYPGDDYDEDDPCAAVR